MDFGHPLCVRSMAAVLPHWRSEQRTLLAGECETLFDMVEALVARAEPWTASQTLGSILKYLESEVQEVRAEAAALGTSADASAEKLTAELGDLMFDALLAVAVSARDHRVAPAAVYAKACEKVRRRAAYFFGDAPQQVDTLQEAERFWAAAKSREEPAAEEPALEEPADAGAGIDGAAGLEEDEPPLTVAVRNAKLEEVESLLQAGGCDVNAADVVGETALFEAALGGSTDVAAVLLLHSANPNHRSLSGSVPADFAADKAMKHLLASFGGGEPDAAAREAALESLSGPIRQRVLDVWRKEAIRMRMSMNR